MSLTKHEKRELKRQQKEQERQAQSSSSLRQKKKSHLVKIMLGVIIIAGIGLFVIQRVQAPGPYEAFAKCLTEKGAKVYGADFCKYTAEQIGMFGKSYKYLDYHDYTARTDIKITPTWIIGEEKYERVQSFEKLAELTGCSL